MITEWLKTNLIVILSFLSAGLAVSLLVYWLMLQSARGDIKTIKAELLASQANEKILEIQKDALIKGVDIQNESIAKLESDAKSRKAQYEKHISDTKGQYEREIESSRKVLPNEELKFLKEQIDEIITVINPTIIP